MVSLVLMLLMSMMFDCELLSVWCIGMLICVFMSVCCLIVCGLLVVFWGWVGFWVLRL